MQKIFSEEEAYTILLQGNEKGLDFFFNRYYSSLVYYSTSYTKNSEVAKEIAAEAFVKLWKKKESIEQWQKVKPLLYKIVHHTSIDFIRKHQTEKKGVTSLRILSEVSERGCLDKLVETETYCQLYRLLGALPPRTRLIFQKFYFEHKSIKEIAFEMGVSVNTVKSQKVRALQLLREKKPSLYYSLIAIGVLLREAAKQ